MESEMNQKRIKRLLAMAAECGAGIRQARDLAKDEASMVILKRIEKRANNAATKIQIELVNAAKHGHRSKLPLVSMSRAGNIDSAAAQVTIDAYREHLVGALFVETFVSRPTLLPHLFPVFALLCGDPISGQQLPKIDWEIFDTPNVLMSRLKY